MKRRLYLTQAGQEMARTADQVLRALKESEETFAALRGSAAAASDRGGEHGQYFAPKLIAMFSARHPEVEMKLSVQNREAVVQLLAANEVDLAIMGQPRASWTRAPSRSPPTRSSS